VEFIRIFSESAYGIPTEQVVGSTGELQFKMGPDGKPVLVRLAKVNLVDDGPGKPVGIQRFIGRRPIFAFGNSDGDQQMLEWTAAGDGPRFMALVYHTDSEREWADDRKSPRRWRALTSHARAGRWSTEAGWKRVFSRRKPTAALNPLMLGVRRGGLGATFALEPNSRAYRRPRHECRRFRRESAKPRQSKARGVGGSNLDFDLGNADDANDRQIFVGPAPRSARVGEMGLGGPGLRR
jgi:hypothetical protein